MVPRTPALPPAPRPRLLSRPVCQWVLPCAWHSAVPSPPVSMANPHHQAEPEHRSWVSAVGRADVGVRAPRTSGGASGPQATGGPVLHCPSGVTSSRTPSSFRFPPFLPQDCSGPLSSGNSAGGTGSVTAAGGEGAELSQRVWKVKVLGCQRQREPPGCGAGGQGVLAQKPPRLHTGASVFVEGAVPSAGSLVAAPPSLLPLWPGRLRGVRVT